MEFHIYLNFKVEFLAAKDWRNWVIIGDEMVIKYNWF